MTSGNMEILKVIVMSLRSNVNIAKTNISHFSLPKREEKLPPTRCISNSRLSDKTKGKI